MLRARLHPGWDTLWRRSRWPNRSMRRFTDHHLSDLQLVVANEIANKLIGLAAKRCHCRWRSSRRQTCRSNRGRSCWLLRYLMMVPSDRWLALIRNLPVSVDHGNFAAGSKAGSMPMVTFGPAGGAIQQFAQVLAEDCDRFFVRFLFQFLHHRGFQ